jgi:hypothetical protein
MLCQTKKTDLCWGESFTFFTFHACLRRRQANYSVIFLNDGDLLITKGWDNRFG